MAYLSYRDQVFGIGILSNHGTTIDLESTSILYDYYNKPSGSGHFAGKLPIGLTTETGVPTKATVRCIVRDNGTWPNFDSIVCKEVESNEDGTWLITGVDETLRYDIIGRKDGYNDVIISNVKPSTAPVLLDRELVVSSGLSYSHQLSVFGGVGSIEYKIVGGLLPEGFTLSDTGLLECVLTGSSSLVYNIQIQMKDDNELVSYPLTITLS